MSEHPSSPAAFPIGKFANIVACLILMVIATTAIVISMNFPTTPIPTDIGAGAFPRLFASILLVLCALLIISELMKKPAAPATAAQKDEQKGKSYLTPAIGVAAMIAYIGLMPYFGYLPLTIIFLVGMIRLLGFTNILFNLLISVTITTSLYFLFDVGLQVPLPAGDLFG